VQRPIHRRYYAVRAVSWLHCETLTSAEREAVALPPLSVHRRFWRRPPVGRTVISSLDDMPSVASATGSPVPGLAPPPFHSVAISGASHRLRSLSALSGSLTDALGPEEAAQLVELQALSALGATSAVVVTLGPFPPRPVAALDADPAPPVLRVVHAIGLPAELRALIDQLPLEALVPLAEVAREGASLFLAAEPDLLRYPAWGAAMISAGARAAAIVPVWANGELRGVLGLAWADPRIFDEDERAFVLTLGVMCAQAIMRAHLRAAEKTASEAALLAQKVAELANKSKADFVATISHELRTPMNAVIGYAQLIADEMCGPVTALQRDHLGRVSASGKHLLGLVEQLLSHARIEAGEEAIEMGDVAVATLVEQSVALVRPLAEQKGLHLQVVGPAEPVRLHTDAGKVRQILVNLLANAVKFSEHGDVALAVRTEELDVNMRVIFEVSDSGAGIAAEHHARIFEPFWRVDPTSTRDREGTGLGLSVARQLARLLGGDLVISTSVPGQGSTFVFSIPGRFAS
jgi:signal transduction histidine kinase